MPPVGSPVTRVLVQPASPAPLTAAPASSKNSRRSMDTFRKLPTLGRCHPCQQQPNWTGNCAAAASAPLPDGSSRGDGPSCRPSKRLAANVSSEESAMVRRIRTSRGFVLSGPGPGGASGHTVRAFVIDMPSPPWASSCAGPLPRHRLAVAGEPMRTARAFRRCRAAAPAQPYVSTAGVNMACAFWARQARATHDNS